MSPKYIEIVRSLADLNYIRYSAYRTAMKLRQLQAKLALDQVSFDNLTSTFEQHGLGPNGTGRMENGDGQNGDAANGNSATQDINENLPYELRLIAVPEIVSCLKTIFETVNEQAAAVERKESKSKSKTNSEAKPTPPINVPLYVDLCLNWLLDLYDA